MSNKDMIFIDTETGGVNASLNPILQIAWIIESQGIIACEKQFDVKPADNDMFCLAALDCNNFTLERMRAASERVRVFEEMRKDIKLVVGGKKPLFVCGHNVKFDIEMIHTAASACSANWWLNFGSNDYIQLDKPICTLAMCHYLNSEGVLDYPNYRLKTVCERLGIPLDNAHDALADVRATREAYHKLRKLLCTGE